MLSRKTFLAELSNLNACKEAINWANNTNLTPEQLWNTCERGDWMLWLADAANIDRKLLVLAACDCATTALQFVPDGEDRPRIAIETARKWCEGQATLEEVRDAAAAAYAAYVAARAAYAAADAAAAYAAYAAAAAGAAAGTVYAAAAAAVTAADAAAGTQKTCADLVCKRISWSVIQRCLI